jgi:hypothetical protein
MSKFTLKCDNEGLVNTLEFDAEYLPNVIENIEIFLMGCGFYIESGALQFMEAEPIESTPTYFNTGDTCLK